MWVQVTCVWLSTPIILAMILDMILCTIFYIGFNSHRSLFCKSEVAMLIAVLMALSHSHAHPLLLSSFFVFVYPFSIENIISLPVALGFAPWDYFLQVYNTTLMSMRYAVYLASVLVLFCLLQALNLKVGSKNAARKMFHFLGFATFIKMQKLNILLGYLVIYASMWVCPMHSAIRHAKFLIRETEMQKDSYSLAFLVFVLTYSQTVLRRKEFCRLLISICIQDSFASFTGDVLRKKKKSYEGMAVGIAVSCAAEFLILRSVDVLYHASVGMVEYRCGMNDNIAIGAFGVGYHLLLRKLRS